jgi:hypothetical protein
MRPAATATLAALALGALPAPATAQEARDRPSRGALVGGGLALALPTYALGVTVHEGSHALAARLMGAEVLDLRLLPGRNPYHGAFQFGWVRVRGLTSDRQRILFLAAPRLPDALVLGGYGLLQATDRLPDHPWGHLVIQVLATGFWVDFSKDVLVFHPHNDVVRIYGYLGLDTEWKRLPARLVHAALAAGTGYLLWLGWKDLFTRGDDDPAQGARAAGGLPLVAPVFATSF